MKRFVCHINNFLYYNMLFDKLFIVLILVMLLGLLAACDAVVPEAVVEEDELEYTTVEYSEDGKEIRLYLDGVGVPVTRSQRAITKDLAMMAYDYIEVMFVGGGRTVRTAWELGYPANINDVYRPFNYNTITNAGQSTGEVPTIAACMFVGKKDGKVLLGVGSMTNTRPAAATPTTIDNNTTSVTFSISTLQSGLEVGGYTSGTPTRTGVATDSFRYTTVARNTSNSFLYLLGGVRYPVYLLANPEEIEDDTVAAVFMTYTFRFINSSAALLNSIRHINTVGGVSTNPVPTIQKRTPRYPDSSGYREPKNLIDTSTLCEFTDAYNVNPTAFTRDTRGFTGDVLLRFVPGSKKGIFAFNFQLPVYMISRAAPFNAGGTEFETWYIRTGVGSEFFSLDDGITRGGCPLMSVGISNVDFGNVEWTWFK